MKSGNVKWCKVEELPDLPLYEWAKKENWWKIGYFCIENCKYLRPTEYEQTKNKEPHICVKYKKQVFHMKHHPLLIRVEGCKE